MAVAAVVIAAVAGLHVVVALVGFVELRTADLVAVPAGPVERTAAAGLAADRIAVALAAAGPAAERTAVVCIAAAARTAAAGLAELVV